MAFLFTSCIGDLMMVSNIETNILFQSEGPSAFDTTRKFAMKRKNSKKKRGAAISDGDGDGDGERMPKRVRN